MEEDARGDVIHEESRLDDAAVPAAESSVENTGGENRAGSFQDEDEGDIMVEVVGSDVFVNGARVKPNTAQGEALSPETEGAAAENRDFPSADRAQELQAEASTNAMDSEVDVSNELSSVGRDKSEGFEMNEKNNTNVESEAEVSTEDDPNATSEGFTLGEGTLAPESAISDAGICSEDAVVSVKMDEVVDDRNTSTASGSSKGREIIDSETGLASAEETVSMPQEVCHSAVGLDSVTENIDSQNLEKAVSEEISEQFNGGVRELFISNGSLIEKDHDSKFTSEELSEETKNNTLFEGNHKPSSFVILNKNGYLSPPEKEGRFSVSDLVWGKVRSHPWWPGQIFDPADASDEAIKYYKKDSFLVAYFGDQTFAWNDSIVLKPFRSCFAEMLKQSNSDAFRNAISCALEEVSRRVALSLSCSCTSRDAHSKIKTQVVKNSGIREDSSRRSGPDKSSRASHFEPAELVQYLRGLAPRSSYGADQLDLVIAMAQLSAYSLFKGYRPPTELPSSEEWIGNDPDSKVGKLLKPSAATENVSASTKELFMDWEFYGDAEDDSFPASDFYSSSGKKRKADHHHLGSGGEGEVESKRLNHGRSSFKIGEFISRVASKLTAGSLDNAEADLDDAHRKISKISAESSSVNSMLSQVMLLACHPRKEDGFPQTVRTFFMGYRSSVALSRRGRKKRSSEDFEFQDVNDSYWTDRIVHNFSEEQMLSNGGDGSLEHPQPQPQQPVKSGRRSYTRKRFSGEALLHHPVPSAAEENAKRQQKDSSPAELIVKFGETSRIPSEINLIKIFRRFGGLMESETEVDHVSGRARVIFKRGFDAEVARNSCEKFNVFGAAAPVVSYQIGYSPLLSVKISPIGTLLPQPQLELAE